MPIVLIVEDEWLLRASLAVEMERAGWRVLEASSGEEAVDILGGSQHVDLLVTDIKLGGPISGWDVADSFRESGTEPVVYASASDADPDRTAKLDVRHEQ